MRYLSIDTEATGLGESSLLIQLAFVPLDTETKTIWTEKSWETLVQCPSYETLLPSLDKWVIDHNKTLIQEASQFGISYDDLKKKISEYLLAEDMRNYFYHSKVVILGKSLSALDIPLLNKTLGAPFMSQFFHHHTLDVTSVAKYLVDLKILPEKCDSSSKMLRYFAMRDNPKHTALSDALDMAEIYIKCLELLKGLITVPKKN